MFGSALTRKLFLSFVAILLLFVVLAGSLTAVFGSRAIRDNYENLLLMRARAAADALSSIDSPFANESETPAAEETETRRPGRGMQRDENANERGRGRGMQGIRGADLRFLDQLLMTDLWILDRQANQITIGTGRGDLSYRVLDIDAQAIVDRVFSGEEVLSRQFSSFFGDTSITAGIPLRDDSGEVSAALLLHDRVEGMDAFLSDTALVLMVTTLIAIGLVLILSALFARRFSRPLLQMSEITRRLARGETGISTGIAQNDEVGALAEDIDMLSVRLKEAREKEAGLEALRRDFSTKLSHELKTPVAVMRSSLEALKDGIITDPAEIQASYDVLCTESRQLDRLIADLLELTALQNPRYPLNKESLDIIPVIQDAIRSQRIHAKEKNIRTEWTAEDTSLPFSGDYGRLRQMFVTVLDNAVKYSPEGACIRVEQGRTNGQVYIRITNPAPRMEKQMLDRLFTQFYRASDTGSGFGLGLSIAREIANRHDIGITVTSEEKTGFRFTFLFPESDTRPFIS